MSSSEAATPVVVLTAGGAGRSPSSSSSSSSKNKRSGNNKANRKKSKGTGGNINAASPANSTSSPESRESTDSFLDQEQPPMEQPLGTDEPHEDDSRPNAADNRNAASSSSSKTSTADTGSLPGPLAPRTGRVASTGSTAALAPSSKSSELLWLLICFLGIMASFVCYGLLLEYATSGGRKLHELSFLFVTSGLYTLTAAAGRYVRDETPTTIPPARFAVLGLTSMGSTFFSVRSLRYVIYPVQVLAKSCKPVPVMLMGAAMGKRYSFRKYVNVCLIVLGVALFMGGGGGGKPKKSTDGEDDGHDSESSSSGASQIIGIVMLFISLCFDGGTGAYEDKLMSVHSVQPFDLMFNIQMGKTILAGIGLIVLNQIHIFVQMCNDMGFLLVALGLSGAAGQVFIFVTIAKFGALTCSIIGLARKVTTLVASIWFYGHHLGPIQFLGLVLSVGAMVMNFWGKKDKHGHHHGPPKPDPVSVEELQKMLDQDENYQDEDVEMTATPSQDEEDGAAR